MHLTAFPPFTDGYQEKFDGFVTILYEGDPFFEGENSLFQEPADCEQTYLFMVEDEGRVIARAAAFMNRSISFHSEPVGLVGYFEAYKNSAAVKLLMDSLKQWFRSQGCQYLIGPVDGSTWRNYRFSLNAVEPFFLDRYHKSYYAELFEETGIQVYAEYFSSIIPCRKVEDSLRITKLEHRFLRQGVTIRAIDKDILATEMGSIYELSNAVYEEHFLFSPIGEKEFIKIYGELSQVIDSHYVLIAERDDEVIGFIVALPDVYSSEEKRLVIKTLGVKKERSLAGLGLFLTREIHTRAFNDGYEKVIHAFIKNGDSFTNIMSQDAEVYQNYRLYGEEIK